MLNVIRANDGPETLRPFTGFKATVKIRGAAEMDKAERKRIAAWLRCQADLLTAEGHEYDRVFTGVYEA